MKFIAPDDSEKYFVARTEDIIERTRHTATPCFTDFLTGREQEVVKMCASRSAVSENLSLFGGFGTAERKIAGFFPDYYLCKDAGNDDMLCEYFPIELLHLKCSGFREHTHRDYLGSILALGVDRSVIGDIIVGENGYSADALVHSRISSFIIDNLLLVGHDRVTVTKGELYEAKKFSAKFLILHCTSQSMRTDAIVSEIIGISRDKAEKLVKSELVSVNYLTVVEKSREIEVGDVISVRGYGKFRISDVGDLNRKGRIRFTVEKYI